MQRVTAERDGSRPDRQRVQSSGMSLLLQYQTGKRRLHNGNAAGRQPELRSGGHTRLTDTTITGQSLGSLRSTKDAPRDRAGQPCCGRTGMQHTCSPSRHRGSSIATHEGAAKQGTNVFSSTVRQAKPVELCRTGPKARHCTRRLNSNAAPSERKAHCP